MAYSNRRSWKSRSRRSLNMKEVYEEVRKERRERGEKGGLKEVGEERKRK